MNTKRSFSTANGRAILGLVLALVLPACGGGGGGGVTGPTTVRKTDNVTGNLNANQGGARDLTTNVSGTVIVTLNWNNASNDHDIYVTSTLCAASDLQAAIDNTGGCINIARADGITTKPERVTFEAPANTPRRIWVFNAGPFSDSYQLTVEYPMQQ